MARFKIDAADVDALVRRAWDTTTGQFVVLECGLRRERTRKIQAMPSSPAIAPYERTRISNRVHVIHPAPLEFAQPIDEFDVAQAIGSMLDGLAWLHDHGITHGAIDAFALTSGPTGGRLSLAGALSQPAHASTEDDVIAASTLAFTLLVGEVPGPEVQLDERLAQSASPPVAAAILAGLDPDPSQRPTAASLATMVRGEYLPTVTEAPVHSAVLVRLRAALALVVAALERGAASVTQAARPYATRVTAGIGAAFAIVLLATGLAVADQRGTGAFADASSPPPLPAVESTVATLVAGRVETPPPSTTIAAPGFVIEDVIAAGELEAQQAAARAAALTTTTTTTTTTLAPTTTAAPAPPPTRAAVVTAPPTTAAPPPTTLAPKPVATTVPATTVAPTPTQPAAPTTRAPTTTRVTTTRAPTTTRVTTTRATTTTRRGNNGRG